MLPRIIAVSDTFDALTTNRPYQQAHDCEDALRIIHSLSGKRLDAAAIAALVAIYQRGDIRIPHSVKAATASATASAAGGMAPASVAFDNTVPAIEMDRT